MALSPRLQRLSTLSSPDQPPTASNPDRDQTLKLRRGNSVRYLSSVYINACCCCNHGQGKMPSCSTARVAASLSCIYHSMTVLLKRRQVMLSTCMPLLRIQAYIRLCSTARHQNKKANLQQKCATRLRGNQPRRDYISNKFTYHASFGFVLYLDQYPFLAREHLCSDICSMRNPGHTLSCLSQRAVHQHH